MNIQNNIENENLGYTRNNYNMDFIENDLHNISSANLNSFNCFKDIIKGNKIHEISKDENNDFSFKKNFEGEEEKEEDTKKNDVQNFLLNMNQFDEI
jgi:hypothetical protein